MDKRLTDFKIEGPTKDFQKALAKVICDHIEQVPSDGGQSVAVACQAVGHMFAAAMQNPDDHMEMVQLNLQIGYTLIRDKMAH